MSTTSILNSHSVITSASLRVSHTRRRKVSYEAGRALEILGHAIQYLEDELAVELASEVTSPLEHISKQSAIQLLKTTNREVYHECPIAPSVKDRVLTLLRRR